MKTVVTQGRDMCHVATSQEPAAFISRLTKVLDGDNRLYWTAGIYQRTGLCSIMTQKAKELYLSYKLEFNYHSFQTSRVLKMTVLRSSETPRIDDPVTAAAHLRRTKSSKAPLGKPQNSRTYCSYSLLWVQFKGQMFDMSLPLTNFLCEWVSSP
jgi:hypothetical protein